MNFYFYSPNTFEPWDWRNPDNPGIGGSETAVVELSRRLAKRGHQVTVYGLIREDTTNDSIGPVSWQPLKEADTSAPGVWIVCRSPKSLDLFAADHPGQQIWLQCQDTLYSEATGGGDITPERSTKVDLVLALCETHAKAMADYYSALDPAKIVISSNGIKSEAIKRLEPLKRDPFRLIWASSPDRGLEATLKVFNRAREFEPRLNIRVCYGWDNINKLIKQHGDKGPWVREKAKVMAQVGPGVVLCGRLGQEALWHEYQQASLWVYCTAFTETSPVRGDSIIETLEYGPSRIDSLIGKEFHVYSCGANGKLSVSKAKDVRCTRQNEPVITLRFRPGIGRNARKETTLTLTTDHEVMLRDGTYLPAGELKLGDRVKAFTRRVDGWGMGYDIVGLTGEKPQPEHRFIAEFMAGRQLLSGEVVDHRDGNTRNVRPENLRIIPSQSDHVKSHWTRMSSDERHDYTNRMTAGSRKFLEDLGPEGVHAMKSKAAYISWEHRRAASNHIIMAIEPAENADVYCMQVDPDHNFVANGIVVHNCISSMEAQALGAIPIYSPIWALRHNVGHGIAIEGQNADPLIQARYVAAILRLTQNPLLAAGIRSEMKPWALARFDWEHVVDQYETLAGVQVESVYAAG